MLSISERYEFNVMKARLAYYDQLFGLEAVAEAIRLAIVNNGEVPRPSVDALASIIGSHALLDMEETADQRNFDVSLSRPFLMKALKARNIPYPITATRDDLLALYLADAEAIVAAQ